MTTELTIILILLFILFHRCRKAKRGTLTLGPGEGTIKVITGFMPSKVKVAFCDCPDMPGCGQLEDIVEVAEVQCDGFILRYDIKSGPRTIKWTALR